MPHDGNLGEDTVGIGKSGGLTILFTRNSEGAT